MSLARRILADGHRNGIAIVPSGDWGTRVLAAFKLELETGGGGLFAVTALDNSLTDYSDSITTVLRISESSAAVSWGCSFSSRPARAPGSAD